MTNEQRVALLREITAILNIPLPRQAHEITIAEAADSWGCSETTARRRLRKAVIDGIMGERSAVADSSPCNVFWLLKDEPSE